MLRGGPLGRWYEHPDDLMGLIRDHGMLGITLERFRFDRFSARPRLTG